jgi:hypothetical protein
LPAQNSTFSPYSRYGLGESIDPSFTHNRGMGGAYAAWRSDSIMPVFLNTGNAASYAFIRYTTLEVGGTYVYSQFKSPTSEAQKWGTNFSYGALGFPMGKRAGGCFGIRPRTYAGYDVANKTDVAGTGTVSYLYSGTGGLSQAFAGYGILPFKDHATNLRLTWNKVPDSLRRISRTALHKKYFFAKFLSDISIGANAEYVFGAIQNTTKVVYPNSLLYHNTYREKTITTSGFTGNLGIQSAFTIDSVRRNGKWTSLNEKRKIILGYALSLNNQLAAEHNDLVYNYVLSGAGNEIVRDTALYSVNQPGQIRLPLQHVIGIGFKRGEKLNIVADFGVTAWSAFSLPDESNTLKDNYRVAIGLNYVPQKDASGRGAYRKRINYRIGASYQTGYISINNVMIADMSASAGFGLPVGIGRLASMIHVSCKVGRLGPVSGNGLTENYVRVGFGFTFSDKWFQKHRYE